MADHDRRDDRSEEDEAIWSLFRGLNQALTRDGDPIGTDEAVKQLRQAMCLFPNVGSSRPASAWGRIKARVYRLMGRTGGTEACIEWLRHTGEFTDKDLNLIRRAKLFYEEAEGIVLLRSSGLNPMAAVAAIATITFVAGIWVGWVLFTEHSGIQTVANSYAIGAVLGLIADRILDRSLRFELIRNKIQSIAPWFAGLQRQ